MVGVGGEARLVLLAHVQGAARLGQLRREGLHAPVRDLAAVLVQRGLRKALLALRVRVVKQDLHRVVGEARAHVPEKLRCAGERVREVVHVWGRARGRVRGGCGRGRGACAGRGAGGGGVGAWARAE
jgi:hypothetical protein